ncbi:hypothetical protein CCM_09374 [Cordyceps militaris CM01]|uniref:Metalloprotease m41 ftsh n=1 Tax=Cordyceps militaris (strain CM01) TaxID=983644 RepID=G3JUL6_CORMM|nr:uncharacterized protein CCM_09374 [Cordyceps militaris CM01]EGX87752.1 hypothetical protein CCM_09374 [Cordyceps militaris CM01]
MSENETERLQQEIAQLRRETAQARREAAQAQREAAQAQREAAQARREAAQERGKNQKTTLEEYLYNCHFHLYQKLNLANLSRCTTGNTSVEGKYYPKRLCRWHEFENTHLQRHFKVIQSACNGRRLFHQESTTIDLGWSVFRKRASSENDVDNFEKNAVEDHVWEILRPVWDDMDLRTEYQCSQIRFSSNRRDMMAAIHQGPSAIAQEFVEDSQGRRRRRRIEPSERMASEEKVKSPPTRPDGWGIRTHPDGDESHAFAFEYKAAHKISPESVKAAVAKETFFMEVIQRICSDKVSTDEARENEKMEEAIAMALTQVFDYMVRYEVAYGYVAAGKSLLLLHVDRADLQTLYCHTCLPEEDVGAVPDGALTDDTLMHTAVAQLASFFLLSLRSEALRGASLEAASQRASATLKPWPEPYEDAACVVEVEKTDSSSDSSQETGSRYTPSVSPTPRKTRSRSSCKATDLTTEGDDEDEDNGPDRGPTRHQPTVETNNKRKDGPSSSSSKGESTEISFSVPSRQYCTQACLLGLKRSMDLDNNCPNVQLHRTREGYSRHPIDAKAFTHLISQQLRQNPYHKCDALDRSGKRGSVGVLFKLELEPYGYTLVGKGALSGRPYDLEHEGTIYARLDRLQGYVVPVHLGLVELEWGHLIAGGIRVFDIMLMSWGGEMVLKAELPGLAREAQCSLQAVWAEGVDHCDERAPNQLWNAERQQVMIIDFDRATLRPKPQNKLLLTTKGTKRKQTGGGSRHSQRRRLIDSQT